MPRPAPRHISRPTAGVPPLDDGGGGEGGEGGGRVAARGGGGLAAFVQKPLTEFYRSVACQICGSKASGSSA